MTFSAPQIPVKALKELTHNEKQREIALLKKRHKQELLDLCLVLYPDNPIGPALTDKELLAALMGVLTACHLGQKPQARDVLRQLHPTRPQRERWVKREAAAKQTERIFPLWKQLQQHPLMQLLESAGFLGEVQKRACCSASLANFGAQLYAITTSWHRQTDWAQQVAKLEIELATRAVNAAMTQSYSVHWHRIADEMHLRKASLGAIAAATGKGKSTIRDYLLKTAG